MKYKRLKKMRELTKGDESTLKNKHVYLYYVNTARPGQFHRSGLDVGGWNKRDGTFHSSSRDDDDHFDEVTHIVEIPHTHVKTDSFISNSTARLTKDQCKPEFIATTGWNPVDLDVPELDGKIVLTWYESGTIIFTTYHPKETDDLNKKFKQDRGDSKLFKGQPVGWLRLPDISNNALKSTNAVEEKEGELQIGLYIDHSYSHIVKPAEKYTLDHMGIPGGYMTIYAFHHDGGVGVDCCISIGTKNLFNVRLSLKEDEVGKVLAKTLQAAVSEISHSSCAITVPFITDKYEEYEYSPYARNPWKSE